MQQATEALNSLISKIGSFFDLFDITYVVSGVSFGLVLLYWNFGEIPSDKLTIDGFEIFIGLVVIYILGIISSMLGRRLNFFLHSFDKYIYLQSMIERSALDQKPIISTKLQPASVEEQSKGYIYSDHSLRGIYVYMWSSIRERNDLTNSLSILKRYWVNSSTFDGLTFCSIVLFLSHIKHLIVNRNFCNFDMYLYGVIILIVTYFLGRESNRFRKYTMEELTATFQTLIR